jgi:hypothetical protein
LAGYSGTPLAKKLGIKPGYHAALVNAPKGFESLLADLPPDAALSRGLTSSAAFDVLIYFAEGLRRLRTAFPKCAQKLASHGGLWVAWPKRASGMASDLTEDIVRGVGLKAGLVDNKVCAIDGTWSGLRFVVRLVDRPGRS